MDEIEILLGLRPLEDIIEYMFKDSRWLKIKNIVLIKMNHV